MTEIEREIGMLWGLVIGDCLGSQRQPRKADELLDFLERNSCFRIDAPARDGADDAALAFCVMESFKRKEGYDLADIGRAFAEFICNGRLSRINDFPIDFEAATEAALDGLQKGEFKNGGEGCQGYGSLMRLAPAYIMARKLRRPEILHEISDLTHCSEEVRGAVDAMAAVLDELFMGGRACFGKKADLTEKAGKGAGVLDAALKVFLGTKNFRDGMLAAIEAGEDAAAIGAVYGQIAGAYYGIDGIPLEWRQGVKAPEKINDSIIEFLGRVAMHKPYKPTENCYCLLENLWCGEYPGDKDDDMARKKIRKMQRFGVTAFIDLTEEGDALPYEQYFDGERRARHFRFPMRDVSVPKKDVLMRALMVIERMLEEGEVVYLHCVGGTGRTGLTAACYLVYAGICKDGAEALAYMRERFKMNPKCHCDRYGNRRESPDTSEQANFVIGFSERSDSAKEIHSYGRKGIAWRPEKIDIEEMNRGVDDVAYMCEGYKTIEALTKKNESARVGDELFRLSFPETPLLNRARLFLEVRYLTHWGGEYTPFFDREISLALLHFLDAYRIPVPLKFRTTFKTIVFEVRRENTAALVRRHLLAASTVWGNFPDFRETALGRKCMDKGERKTAKTYNDSLPLEGEGLPMMLANLIGGEGYLEKLGAKREFVSAYDLFCEAWDSLKTQCYSTNDDMNFLALRVLLDYAHKAHRGLDETIDPETEARELDYADIMMRLLYLHLYKVKPGKKMLDAKAWKAWRGVPDDEKEFLARRYRLELCCLRENCWCHLPRPNLAGYTPKP